MKDLILLTGATGTVGKHILTELGALGANVRCLVRNPEKVRSSLKQIFSLKKTPQSAQSSLEIVQGDINSGDQLDQAIQNVSRLFLLTVSQPSQVGVEHRLCQLFKNQKDVDNEKKHVVKMSVLGANTNHPTSSLTRWHAWSENAVISSGLPTTLIRPNLFMQNFLRDDSIHIKTTRQFYRNVSVAETKISHIDVRDIADVAARCLIRPIQDHAGQTYELTGAKALTYQEIASLLSSSAITNVPIQCVELSDSQFNAALLESGYPLVLRSMLIHLYKMYRTDPLTRCVSHDYEIITGKKPRCFMDFLVENKSFFI